MYRTLLGVSKEFVLIGCVLRKRSVFILYFTHPHLFNENKLRTHTLLGESREFVLRGKAMYRTLLATCGSAKNRCLYLIYNRCILWVLFFNEDELQNVVGPHALQQRAVHCLAMRTNSCFLTFGNGETGWKFGIRNWNWNWSNVKVPHLARKV